MDISAPPIHQVAPVGYTAPTVTNTAAMDLLGGGLDSLVSQSDLTL